MAQKAFKIRTQLLRARARAHTHTHICHVVSMFRSIVLLEQCRMRP